MAMTLEQKIGSMLMVGWWTSDQPNSYAITDDFRQLMADIQPGGVILYSRNISPSTVADTITELQNMSSSSTGQPLLVAVDHEGGLVNRFPTSMIDAPPASAVGRMSTDEARGLASSAGSALAALGFNCNLAPVADVASDVTPPMMLSRCYGSSAETVSAMASAVVSGYASAGLITCAKHFPGMGHLRVDAHAGSSVVDIPSQEIESIDLPPFASLISAGIPCIMTGHAVYSSLDPGVPASLSSAITTDLLRTELGFTGVVLTDSLEMYSVVSEEMTVTEAAVRAVEAGADMLIVPHTAQTQTAVRDAILSAVGAGRISEQRIDESVARISELKQVYL